MSDVATKQKFVYHSSPIFRESDKEGLAAWETRKFDEIVVFCKLHQSPLGVFGVGYDLVFTDGWSHGSFSEQLGKIAFEKACLRALYEILLHLKEESAKRVYIWTENKKFFEQITEDAINRDKELQELHKSFESVTISLVSDNEIENFNDLRDSADSKARFGSTHRTRRKRWKVLATVSDKEEDPAEVTRRWEEITEILVESAIQYQRRPVAEKLLEAQNELKDLEKNCSEEPEYEKKKQELIDKILKLSETQKKIEETLGSQKSEDLPEKIVLPKDVCPHCSKKTKPNWKYCPNCSHKLGAQTT